VVLNLPGCKAASSGMPIAILRFERTTGTQNCFTTLREHSRICTVPPNARQR
jgi:hypothetical protein